MAFWNSTFGATTNVFQEMIDYLVTRGYDDRSAATNSITDGNLISLSYSSISQLNSPVTYVSKTGKLGSI